MAQISNITQPTADLLHSHNPTTTRWYWTIRVFVALFTIIGNLPLIVLFISRRKLRRILSNRFVMSLNLSDLCVGLFVTPPELVCTHWMKCDRRTELAMYEFFVYTSMLCLCLVTWDRYKSVIRPLTYPVVVTAKQFLIPILMCWLVPLVVALLHFTYLVHDPEQQHTGIKVFTVMETVLFIALPCLGLPMAYLHIILIIRKHRKLEKKQQEQVDFNYSDAMLSDHGMDALRETEMSVTNLSPRHTRAHASSIGQYSEKLSVSGLDSDMERSTDGGRTLSAKSKQRQPNHDRSITVLGLVITWFVFCWILATFLELKKSFTAYAAVNMVHSSLNTTMNMSWMLLLVHSALNPFIYGFVKKDIRNEMIKFVTCRK